MNSQGREMTRIIRLKIIVFVFYALVNASTPPFYTKQPQQNIVLTEGDTAYISVAVGGSAPFTYEWVADTGVISGANDSLLMLEAVTRSENGKQFYCIASNSFGSNTSRSATLIVKRPSSHLIVVSGDISPAHGGTFQSNEKMDFIVRLYPSREGGTAIYAENFFQDQGKGVNVENNRFFIRLGEGETDDILRETVQRHPSLYISFSVSRPGGNFETLSPRTPLTASPYSLTGVPEVVRGIIDPRLAGLEAPVGTHYIDNTNGTTYIRTHNSWVELE